MNKKELYWFAGLLEGEGSFMKGNPSRPHLPIISVEMTDKDIVEKICNIFGNKCISPKTRNILWKKTYRAKLVGKKAVNLMKTIKPLMGIRRQKQIGLAISTYKDLSNTKLSKSNVLKIKRRLSNKEKHFDIAKDFGVSRSTISYINSGKSWKMVDMV